MARRLIGTLIVALLVVASIGTPAQAGPSRRVLEKPPDLIGLLENPPDMTGPLENAPDATDLLEDPPDVTGLPVADAVKVLTDWNKGVVIRFQPPLDQLTVDRAAIVVARAVWPSPPVTFSAVGPVVELFLGRLVPGLSGLTPPAASSTLEAVAFRPLLAPDGAGPDWTVAAQDPAPGTLVEFLQGPRVVRVTLAVPVVTSPPTPPPPPPPPPPHPSTVEIALVGASGAGALLLLVLGALAVRRSLRRPRRASAAEHVRVQAYPGEITGPTVRESAPGVSVRLVAHPDPGTVTLEEARR